MKESTGLHYKLIDEYKLIDNNNHKTDSVFNSVSEGITITDLDGNILVCNELTYKLHGFSSREEIIGRNAIDFISNEDRQRARKNMKLALKNGFVEKLKYRCLRKDGSEFIAEISATLLKNELDEPIGFLGVTKDISEISKANEQIRLLITALEHAANSIVITDADGSIIWVNSAFNKVTGYSDNELLGENLRILKSGFHSNEFYKNLWDTILSGKTWKGEIINKRKDGTIYYEETTITPIEYNNRITNFIAIKQDITDKKKSEEETNLLIHALKSISEIVVITDTSNNIIFTNNAVVQKTGYHEADLLGKKIDVLFTDKTPEKILNEIQSHNLKKVWRGETPIIRKDRSEFPAILFCSPVQDNLGHIIALVYAASDITKRKEAENQLFESERKFRSLFENSTLGIYRADKNGKLLMANPQLLKILGFNSIEEFNNTKIDSEAYTDFNARRKFMRILKSEGTVFGFESKWKKPDGEIIYIRESAKAFWNFDGNLNFYEGTLEDITERVQVEGELKKHTKILSALRFESEEFLKSHDWQKQIKRVISKIGKAFNASGVFIFERNKQESGKIKFLRKTKWVNKFSGCSLSEINNTELNESILNNWLPLLEKNEPVNISVSNSNSQGEKYLNSLKIKSLFIIPIFVNGNLWGGIELQNCNSEKIYSETETEALKNAANIIGEAIQRKDYETQLIKAKQEAEKSDKLKSEFLAQISHEIRTPLNNILNFTNLIKEEVKDSLSEELKTSFQIIENSSDRLIRTIGLLINISELQTGNFNVIKRKVDVYEEVLKPLYLENKFKAENKYLEFKLVNEANNSVIKADKYSIEQIFSNLIDNAIKFTEKGKIRISLFNPSNDSIIIEIEDTGIGISENFLPNLFSPFSQEQQGYTRKFEGNGLGLTLVKKYCELNNAEISVSGKKNIGTKFTLKFPLFTSDNKEKKMKNDYRTKEPN